jgi:hypothetical protein
VARIDDYKKALEIGKGEISKKNPLHLCRVSGGQFIEKANEPNSIQIKFLNRMVTISWPDLIFSQDSDKEITIKEKILILHYLNNAKKEDLTGELIAYQEIPSARFYLSAFNARSRDPFIAAFGGPGTFRCTNSIHGRCICHYSSVSKGPHNPYYMAGR